MKFLITNDDGIHAPGLAALEQAAARLGETVVVAPDQHLSGCSHHVTTHRPLVLSETLPGWHMLDGSPADCARVGIAHLAPEADWVLSGVNEGGNLGADVYLSGTVAAAREACLLGKRAIALSQYHHGPIDWQQATEWSEHIVRMLIQRPLPAGSFWNVNFPQTEPGSPRPETVFCQLDPHALPVRYDARDGQLHYSGSYHQRSRLAEHDVDVCFSGRIAITLMRLREAAASELLM